MWPARRPSQHPRAVDDASAALAVQLRAISWIALVAMIPLVFYFTTEGTWRLTKQRNDGGWSGGFYMAQAESLLVHGRLDVHPDDLLSECLRRGSRCYGYFGLTPSLVRVPFLGILRYFHSAMTPLFLGVAVLLAYWAALRLLARALVGVADASMPRAPVLGYAILGALLLGPGGSLMFLTRPAVYEEAIGWGIACFLFALNWIWAWHAREVRSLVPAILLGIAAANARPTLAVACGVLGLVVFALSYPHPARSVRNAALCISLLPGLTAAGVLYLKVRSPLPDHHISEQMTKAPHWRIILNRNGDKTAGLMFAPTELFAYFRPDALTRTREWPFFDFRRWQEMTVWLPPLPEGGAYVERYSSLTATMPLSWIVNVLVVIWLAAIAPRSLAAGRDGAAPIRAPSLTREQWILAAGSVASAASMVLFTVTTVGITNRYLADFYPLSAVGFALGAYAIMPFCRTRPFAFLAALVAGALLTGWSVAVTLALTWRLLFE
ncbi:MAG TPA: hypothetical protein VH417_13535 [Vicinamibacterales bacterium]|jgi:hypothetical protein